MSTIKTPEQIAQTTLDAHAIRPDWRRSGEQILGLITEAIEADRAQRQVSRPTWEMLNALLAEWESLDDDVDSFIQKWVTTLDEGPAARIAELTAGWEEATNYGADEPHRASDYALSEDDWKAGLSDDEAAEIVRLIEWREGQK